MAASMSPQVNSAAAYDGVPGCWLDDTITPNRVQASTSMCGYTLRWLINLSLGKRSSSEAWIFVRSRMRTRTSASFSRSVSASSS